MTTCKTLSDIPIAISYRQVVAKKKMKSFLKGSKDISSITIWFSRKLLIFEIDESSLKKNTFSQLLLNCSPEIDLFSLQWRSVGGRRMSTRKQFQSKYRNKWPRGNPRKVLQNMPSPKGIRFVSYTPWCTGKVMKKVLWIKICLLGCCDWPRMDRTSTNTFPNSNRKRSSSVKERTFNGIGSFNLSLSLINR